MLEDHARSEPSFAPKEEGASALTVVPRDVRSAAPAPEPNVPARREPTAAVPAADDPDAERVAFTMWREGRTDDAIAFLEREILLEKDRLWKRDAFTGRREPHFGKPEPEIIVTPPPVSESAPKRRRKRGDSAAPVSEPTFSDASAPVIDLSAETVASEPILPPTQRMGRGPAIVAAIGLVIVGFAAAANIWDNRRAATAEQVAPAIVIPPVRDDRIAPDTTASIQPAKAEPVAATEPPALDIPPPLVPDESGAAGEDAATVIDPEEIVTEPEETVALADPGEDSFSPPEELDDAALDDGTAFEEDATAAALPRLPRQRPEPPAGVIFGPPTQTAAVSAAPAGPQRYVPPPAPAPPGPLAQPQPYASDGLPRPFYGSNGLPQRETLSPEEYEALLTRRAIAEDYVARRRAVAEDPVPAERRVILRLLRR